ncbi:MAG: TMEM165/GDT1 family protein [Candidatus Margulisbacteria bacterium]|nr:TMEM165/GDT1 family protein [Candidatus Margulisiibacteriota bacterium]
MSLAPFLAALTVIALAELGDKTQLLTFGLATRYPFWTVISAVASATALLMGIAVILGGFLNQLIPLFYLQLFAGTLFILFGFWTLFGKEDKDDGEEQGGAGKGAFGIVFSSFFLAELGDKTQLATLALTAKYGAPVLVWAGATLGMIVVNGLSILAGGWLGKHLAPRLIKYVGAAVFILFGLWTFFELFRA